MYAKSDCKQTSKDRGWSSWKSIVLVWSSISDPNGHIAVFPKTVWKHSITWVHSSLAQNYLNRWDEVYLNLCLMFWLIFMKRNLPLYIVEDMWIKQTYLNYFYRSPGKLVSISKYENKSMFVAMGTNV